MIDEYIETLPQIIQTIATQGIDTEHAHFGSIDKNYVVEFDNLHCEGVLAGNGQTER